LNEENFLHKQTTKKKIMPPKLFLDYLVAIGLGRKDTIMVKTDRLDFPHDKIPIQRGTSFFTPGKTVYTIEVPIAVSDNTRVQTQIPYPGGSITKPDLLEKIVDFFTSIANWQQPYGVTFYSPTWGNKNFEGNPYRAKHHGGYINLDFMFPLMGAFGGIREGLNIAWAIKHLTDLIVEMRNNENTTGNKIQKTISKTRERKEKESTDTLNVDKRKNETVLVQPRMKVKIEYITSNDSSWQAPGDRPGGFLYQKGDTIGKVYIEYWGEVEVKSNIEYFHSRDTID